MPAMQETQVCFLGWEDTLQKEMATHSSILTWRIPCSEESTLHYYQGLILTILFLTGATMDTLSFMMTRPGKFRVSPLTALINLITHSSFIDYSVILNFYLCPPV